VRDLIRDVERNYWELYFAYRDLDTKLAARDAARETWENRQVRFEKGVGRPDEEAQARQQFYSFEFQVQNALAGTAQGQSGVLGAERNLRRLLGLGVNDGRLLRPSTDPAIAPIVFDWTAAQEQALDRRVELRRQKWSIKQREMELLAAKQLNLWRLDMVGQYGFRGFGDELFGQRDLPEGSAVADLFTGDLDDWQVGFDMSGPLGMRQGHLAVRNAELRLARERTILREQQRQIMHDLAGAYAEVDRAMANIRNAYNAHIAAQEELEPKRLRVEEGKDQVFFLLDAQQRYATAESAFYRAIVDYNQALLNFTYNCDGLLSRYNVRMDEADWDGSLQMIAQGKAGRFVNNGWGSDGRDLSPLSAGVYDQTVPPIGGRAEVVTPAPAELPEENSESIGGPELPFEPFGKNSTNNRNPVSISDLPKVETVPEDSKRIRRSAMSPMNPFR
jgi:outer membrane protein TolC